MLSQLLKDLEVPPMQLKDCNGTLLTYIGLEKNTPHFLLYKINDTPRPN